MKLLNPLIVAVLLAALSGSALAELKLIKRHVMDDLNIKYAKLVSDDGQICWVTLNRVKPDQGAVSYFLRIENFFDDGSSRRVELDKAALIKKRFGLAYVSPFPQQDIFAMGTHEGEWSVIKLNKALTKVEKTGELKPMLLGGPIIKVGDKYFIGGIGKDSRPVLVKMNSDLRIKHVLKVPSKSEGVTGSIFTLKSGKLFATIGFTDGSEIWELSPDLSPLKKIKLPGLGTQGIPLRDGGFAVTYMTLPNWDIFVERFNPSAQSVWKKKIYTGAGKFPVLFELQDGLGLVAGNNDRLMVARIDANGQRVRITEDTRNGLRVPTHPDQYLVGVRGNDIHIRGVAPNPDTGSKINTTSTSFHFIETP